MLAAGSRDRRFPFVGRADIGERQRGKTLGDFEDAGEILRSLDVTGKPVKVIGGPRQHRSIREARQLADAAERVAGNASG